MDNTGTHSEPSFETLADYADALRRVATELRTSPKRHVEWGEAAALVNAMADHLESTRLDDAQLSVRQLRIVAAELCYAWKDGNEDMDNAPAAHVLLEAAIRSATGGR